MAAACGQGQRCSEKEIRACAASCMPTGQAVATRGVRRGVHPTDAALVQAEPKGGSSRKKRRQASPISDDEDDADGELQQRKAVSSTVSLQDQGGCIGCAPRGLGDDRLIGCQPGQ